MSTLFSHFFTKFNQIIPQEHNFTKVLGSIALKPKTLYFYGNLPENVSKNDKIMRPKAVAIVGSRHNTTYGKEVAYQMAYELAKKGVIIISGLAYGIDSIGHQAALDAGGTTVAVLGTPIDQIYPKNHLNLAKGIIASGGAIMSEYPPSKPEYYNSPLAPGEYLSKNGKRSRDPKLSFLHRNRLVSGLADAVVIVEAAARSGTLNTAAHALNQGKDVFAVPGNITSPYSEGCNKLISQGAIPYTEPSDILRILLPEELTIKPRQKHKTSPIGDTEEESAILRAIFDGARDGEQIIKITKISPAVFNETVTILEIKGQIRSLGANQWSLS